MLLPGPMTRFGCIMLAASMLVGAAVPPVAAVDLTHRDTTSIVAAARAIVDAYSELGWFSGSVLLAEHGEPILTMSVGMANREAQTPNRHSGRRRPCSQSSRATIPRTTMAWKDRDDRPQLEGQPGPRILQPRAGLITEV